MTEIWFKGLSMRGGGIRPAKPNAILTEPVSEGRARPGFVVSGEIGSEDAPERFSPLKGTKVYRSFLET